MHGFLSDLITTATKKMLVGVFNCHYRWRINVNEFFVLSFVSYVMQWKFASFSMGRPDYLLDTDVVYNRFQVRLLSLDLLKKK